MALLYPHHAIVRIYRVARRMCPLGNELRHAEAIARCDLLDDVRLVEPAVLSDYRRCRLVEALGHKAGCRAAGVENLAIGIRDTINSAHFGLTFYLQRATIVQVATLRTIKAFTQRFS